MPEESSSIEEGSRHDVASDGTNPAIWGIFYGMPTSPRLFRRTAAVAALAALAACHKAPASGDDLARDLDLANSSNELALSPTAGHRDVVSSVERSPDVVAAPRRSRPSPHVTVPQKAPEPAPPAPVSVPTTSAPTPAPSTTTVETPRPAPAPTPQRTPRGGWGTVGDVIRNAPFPINP